MDDLLNERVIVRDSTGSSTEGTFQGVETDADGLSWVKLTESRQINYVDATQDNQCEAWEIEGLNRIAKHLVVGIHKSHLPAPVEAKSRARQSRLPAPVEAKSRARR